MFDLGLSELMLIGAVALVVLGPERLPKAARMAGAMLRRLRGSWKHLHAELEREIATEELKQSLHETADAVHKTDPIKAAQAVMQETADAVKKSDPP